MAWQERDQLTVKERLQRGGVKIPEGMTNVVEVRNTANKDDQLMQTDLYDKLNYEQFHKDDRGVYMGCSKENAEGLVKHYQDRSRKGLKTKYKPEFSDGIAGQDEVDEDNSESTFESTTGSSPEELRRIGMLSSRPE